MNYNPSLSVPELGIENIDHYYRYHFLENVELWKFYLDSYTGGQAYKDGGYLFKHTDNESESEFNRRRDLTIFNNLCKKVVNHYSNIIFSNKPARTVLNNNIIQFKDWQNRVVDIDTFFKYVFIYELVFGEIYVLIDHPIVENIGSISNLERERNKIYFTAQVLFPFFVRNTHYDNNGEISEILIESNNQYKLWTNSTVYIWEKRYSEGSQFQLNYVDAVPHDYRIVPAIRYAIDLNQDGVGDSILSDIAPINKVIYNLDSIPTYDLLTNANNKWTIPMNFELAQSYEAWGMMKDGKIILDSVKYILHDPQGIPQALLKELGYHTQIKDWRTTLIEDVEKSTAQKLTQLYNQSGIAMAYSQENSNIALQLLASIAETNEKQFWVKFSEVIGNPIPYQNVDVTYNKTFDLIDRDQELTNLIAIKDTTTLPIMKNTIDEIILNKFIKNEITEERYNEIMEEIKKGLYNDTESDVSENYLEKPVDDTELSVNIESENELGKLNAKV